MKTKLFCLILLLLLLTTVSAQLFANTSYAKGAFTEVTAEENSWKTMQPLPIQGVNGVVAFNGKIYAIGYTTNPVYEYDPKANNWTFKTQVPTYRELFATATAQNRIYIIGGGIERDSQGNLISCGTNQAYDPLTNSWENKEAMPTKRIQAKAVAVDGKIYVIGGRTAGPYSTVNTTEIYDPTTDTWRRGAPMIYPVTSFALAAVDSKIYVIGGQDEFDMRMNINNVQIYDATMDTWSLGTDAPVNIVQATAGATTGTAAPKRIYIMGGSSGFATALNQNLVYNPESDSWTTASSLPTARYNPQVAVVDDLLYVIGGEENLRSLSVVERYTPFGYSKSADASAPSSSDGTPLPSSSPSTCPTAASPEEPLRPTSTASPIPLPVQNSTPASSLIELPYAAGNFTPVPNATNVPTNTTISITFARPPQICNLTLIPNVAIKERTFHAEGFGGTYVFHLAELLQPQTTYTVTVTFGQETAPEGFAPTSTRTWSFTTTDTADSESKTENYNIITITAFIIIVIVIVLATLGYIRKSKEIVKTKKRRNLGLLGSFLDANCEHCHH